MKYLILSFFLLIFSNEALSYTYTFFVPCQNEEIKDIKIDKNALVARHNYYRRKHGIPDLKWSDELATQAERWAQRCAISCNAKQRKNNPYGCLLYQCCAGHEDWAEKEIVDSWADSEAKFDHKNRKLTQEMFEKFGSYTQVIWKDTKFIGASAKSCSWGCVWVCYYDPPGNYMGKTVY